MQTSHRGTALRAPSKRGYARSGTAKWGHVVAIRQGETSRGYQRSYTVAGEQPRDTSDSRRPTDAHSQRYARTLALIVRLAAEVACGWTTKAAAARRLDRALAVSP